MPVGVGGTNADDDDFRPGGREPAWGEAVAGAVVGGLEDVDVGDLSRAATSASVR